MAAFKYIELSKAKVNKNLHRIIADGRKRGKKSIKGMKRKEGSIHIRSIF